MLLLLTPFFVLLYVFVHLAMFRQEVRGGYENLISQGMGLIGITCIVLVNYVVNWMLSAKSFRNEEDREQNYEIRLWLF